MAAKLTKTSTPGIYRRHAKGCARTVRVVSCAYAVEVRQGTLSTFADASQRRGRASSLAQRQVKLSRGARAMGCTVTSRGEECLRTASAAHGSRSRQRTRCCTTTPRVGRALPGHRPARLPRGDPCRGSSVLEALRAQLLPAPVRCWARSGLSEVAEFVGWLVEAARPTGALPTSRSATALPVLARLATAQARGDIRTNPVTGAALPHRPRVEEDEDCHGHSPERRGARRWSSSYR